MTRTRLALVIVAAAAVIGFGILLRLGPDQPADTAASAEQAPVDVDIANASTKQEWLEAAAAAFASRGITTASGRAIRVRLQPVLSGGSMQAILEGRMKPTAWSPGSSSWVEAFGTEWKRMHSGRPAMTSPCSPTIFAPLGIAMWRPMAQALGWPDKPVGWKTIVALAADPEGWKSYGHPEWDRFRLGYPHPLYSNVGMLFMTAIAYGTEGKTQGLAPAEVYGSSVKLAMTAIAQNTARYGMQSGDLLSTMAEQGPQFLYAVAAFENDTLALNLAKADRLQSPLAFIFPSEGTFWSDQPFCILDRTDWASPDAVEAAHRFLDFLLERDQQVLATTSMLRPLDASLPLGDRLTLANGTDPRVGPKTAPRLAEPPADLMRAIGDMFQMTKRKATLLVVIDTSASMAGEKMRSATTAIVNFLKRLNPEDMVGIVAFNDRVRQVVPPQRVDQVVETLAGQVNALYADGGTALYASTCEAVRIMADQRRADRAAGLNRLYGIVLVSDGQNSAAGITENEMHETCLKTGEGEEPIRVNPIAFGADADTLVLSRMASVTGGTLFTADPQSIEKTYLNLSAEQ